jgi:pimeloyl-ACP methyl ester carboxylesterase
MRDALAMVDLIAQDGPVILVASSNGGWVSTYVASVRPERIAALALIGKVLLFLSSKVFKIKYFEQKLSFHNHTIKD